MITLKPSIAPATRKTAVELLAAHLKGDDETVIMPRDGIEALYKYFLPTPPKKAKTAAQWVAKAVADKKDVREYLRYVYSDGEHLVATDGHRIHWIKTNDYPAGYYCPKSLERVDYDAKYPDWKRASQGTDTPEDLASYSLGDLPLHPQEYNKKTYCYHVLKSKDGEDVGVDSRYLDAAINGDKTVQLSIGGPKDIIKGINEFGNFVVMPFRI